MSKGQWAKVHFNFDFTIKRSFFSRSAFGPNGMLVSVKYQTGKCVFGYYNFTISTTPSYTWT